MQIQFHWYGFIIGVAIITASELIQRKAEKSNISQNEFYRTGIFALLFGVVGARFWHVITDYWVYLDNLWAVLYIWNGGLSILGGVLGGIIGLFVYLRFFSEHLKNKKASLKYMYLQYLDLAVFGLPLGQAIGRFANYINQELYGVPTTSLFKIFIRAENRFPGYSTVEYYHPLFFYEAVLTTCFTICLYYLEKREKLPKVGTGNIFLSYVFYYSFIRFFLDFLRIDRGILVGGLLGINQIILIFVLVVLLIFYILKCRRKKLNV